MLEVDFSDADIIFTHCTCFSPELMDGITARFNQLKAGARVITVSKGLTSPLFVPIATQTTQMAWGTATAPKRHRISATWRCPSTSNSSA